MSIWSLTALQEGQQVTLVVSGISVTGTVRTREAFLTAMGRDPGVPVEGGIYLHQAAIADQNARGWFVCHRSAVEAVLFIVRPEPQSERQNPGSASFATY
jgi:hypothetical protein